MSFQTKVSSVTGGAAATNVTVKQYGISPVISTKLPTPEELLASQQLDDVLHAKNLYESDEDGEAREMAIGSLNEILQQWMREETIALGLLDPSSLTNTSLEIGKILTFGSFRLGVHGPGADMDTLVVGPHFITRQMFFDKFTKRLEERTDLVSELTSRTEAYVPVITFRFSGIEFDLLYAQMAPSPNGASGIGSTNFNIYDDHILRSVDPKSILSLNGARVTDMVLSLMPSETVTNFRMALRFIRLWAKNRGVYSNVFGYLGGVSWGILTAYVCQLYPLAAPSKLLEKFFQLYQQWKWPFPIFLNEPKYDVGLGLPVWNPKENYRDKQDLMPIITPAYPCMNSTHNVSRATLKVLQAEFARGHELFEELAQKTKRGEKIEKPEEIWEKLLEESTFFFDHKDYLDVKVSSRKEEDQLMWLGYVESKMRQLIMPLSRMDAVRVVPFPKNFTEKTATYTSHAVVKDDATGEERTIETRERLYVDHFFVGLEFDLAKLQKPAIPVSTTAGETANAASGAHQPPVQLNLSDAVITFRSFVFDLFSIKDPERSQRGFNCDVTHLKSKQLPEFVFKTDRRPVGWGKKAGGSKKRKDATAAAAATATATTVVPAAATPTTVTPDVNAMHIDSSPSALTPNAAAGVKTESDSSASIQPDAKRAKLEHDASPTDAIVPTVKIEPTPMMTDAADGVTKPVSSSGSDASSPDAAPVVAAADGSNPGAKTESTASSALPPVVKTEDEPSHRLHEVQLALPNEPVIAAGESTTAAASSTATSDTSALVQPSPPTSGVGYIAANIAVVRKESEAEFEVKRKAPTQRSMVAIKISSIAPKAATTTTPATKVNVANAAGTATETVAPTSAASAQPSTTSQPTGAPSSPPIHPTNAPSAPPSTPLTSTSAGSSGGGLPQTSPSMSRPGSFIKPAAPPTPGASRIRTSDEVEEEQRPKQQGATTQQQQQQQQQHQHNQQHARRDHKRQHNSQQSNMPQQSQQVQQAGMPMAMPMPGMVHSYHSYDPSMMYGGMAPMGMMAPMMANGQMMMPGQMMGDPQMMAAMAAQQQQQQQQQMMFAQQQQQQQHQQQMMYQQQMMMQQYNMQGYPGY